MTARSLSLLRSEWIYSHIRTLPWPKHAFPIPTWQAHRGYWKSGYDQNSLNALIEARQRGAKMAEFDVRLTLDGVPVLFHDESFSGPEELLYLVSRITLKQLRTHRAVNTLEEVLLSDKVPEYLNIEIKSNLVLSDPLERKVAELIEKIERKKSRLLRHRLMFSSFNPVSIYKLAQFLPDIPRGFLASRDVEEIYLREMWMSLVRNFHILHLDQDMITEHLMRLWNKNKVPVAAWTVNDPERMRSFLKWGVVSVISDEIPPDEILSFRS